MQLERVRMPFTYILFPALRNSFNIRWVVSGDDVICIL